jgi:nucleoside-diphosphate-sugar epimerase
MNNKTILITGATGFVGSRLVERLVLGTDYQVKAMVRRFTGPGLARLSRLPVELVLADLLDPEALAEATKNCDIVVHCAYGSSGNSEQRKQITISGTENVLQAALQEGVQKVIYLSSAAVHGRSPQGPLVEETSPFGKDSDVYSVSKIEAEKIVWRYHQEHGLPVVVFRPTLIYGPYGGAWTVRIAKEVQSGVILVNDGQGAANLIYVDNLIDAILQAMEQDSGHGQAFILTDDEQLTWQDVYRRYADMVDDPPPFQSMPAQEIEALRQAGQQSTFNQWFIMPWQVALKAIRHALRPREIRREIRRVPWVPFISRPMPRRVKDLLKGEGKSQATTPAAKTDSSQVPLPGKDAVELYASRARFSNDKVKRVLGHTQRITFDEAIELIHSWLQYQGVIP